MVWTIKNSAITVGISYQYAKKVVKEYNEKGAERIKNKRKQGKKHPRGKKPLLWDYQRIFTSLFTKITTSRTVMKFIK